MTEATIVALLGTLGVIVTAAATAVGIGFGLLWRRISELDHRVAKIGAERDRLRWWAYDVKDLYYRYRKPDGPDLPPIPETEEEP